MKILCVIPARFSSTRLPGKPLADICGKPMIYHTFKAARQVRDFSEIIVATDSKQILQVCSDFGIPALLTSENCEEHISRVWEVARQKEADLYVCINGDEPLIEPEAIRKVLSFAKAKKRFFVGAYRILNSASKVIDSILLNASILLFCASSPPLKLFDNCPLSNEIVPVMSCDSS